MVLIWVPVESPAVLKPLLHVVDLRRQREVSGARVLGWQGWSGSRELNCWHPQGYLRDSHDAGQVVWA